MKRFVALAAAAFALGGAVLVYTGPGRDVVRGHVGDVAATMLVYAIVGLIWRGRVAYRSAVTLAFATAIEVGQAWWHVESPAGSLLLGTTFDVWDLVAYVAGTAVGVLWEITAPRRSRVPSTAR